MNRIFRLVWNESTGSWVAVAETALSRGKGSGRSACKAMLAALVASGFGIASALAELPATTVVPASGKTNAYISANGVPVVNIETANSSGLSHNYYTKYNVEAKGLVLNNGNSAQIARQSQLAGQVSANLNLGKEATIILNEVVSTNRSILAGFTEVLGGKADVIVANPNGITCNGCGFINTDRVTLTTGKSNMAGDGSLTGFTVNMGDILIEGLGANASTQQIFDLVTRSVKVDGKVNSLASGSLGITTGNNIWNYTSRNVTGSVAGSGAAPSFAFDSTALGGMYAGRIRIIATEAGVGVRMLGEVGASADDFTLSSAGKIEIQSAMSAVRDVSITSTSASGTEDLFFNGAGAKISASRDLALTAATGQIKLTDGNLYAANNLTLTGATLSDTSTAAATRFAGVNNTLATTGAASINGSVWGAGSALSGTFGSLSIGAGGATIYAGSTLGLNTTNDLALATAAVNSVGNMTLAASAGAISATAGSGQGVQTTAGNLSLTAGNGLTNAGTMTADLGSVTARVDGTLTNSGTLHAKTTLDIADKTNGSTENVTNSGVLIADGGLTAKAAAFTNQSGGTVQGTAGTTLNAASLTNAGIFTASNSVGQTGTLTLANFTNSGTLQSSQDLILNVTTTLANSGKLLATRDLSVNAGSSALTVTNANSGVMQAANTLTVVGSNATFDTQSGTVLGNAVGVTVSSLNNSGTLQSNAAMTLAIGNGLTNSGTLLAKTGLSSNSASLTNSGSLQANQGSTITITGALANTGNLIASDSASHLATLNAGTLSNTGSGLIQSAQGLAINVSGSTFTNANKIIAANDLTVTSTGTGLALTNQSGGYLQGGSASGDTLAIGGTAVVLNNNAGGFLLGDQLGFTLASLTNGGTIQGGAAASTVNASGALSNTGTLSLSTNSPGSGTITASTLSNTGTGVIQSAKDLAINLSGGTLTNAGKIVATRDLTLTSTGSGLTIGNQSGGYLQAGGVTGDTLTIGGTAVVLNNNGGANMLGDQLAFTLASLTNAGILQGGAAASTITASGTVTNSGTLTLANSAAGSGSISADTIDNSGTLQSQGAAALDLATALTNSGSLLTTGVLTVRGTDSAYTVSDTGRMQSGGLMDVKGQGGGSGVDVTIGGSGVMFGNSMDVKVGTLTVTNGGMVTSSGNMTIAANTLSFGGTTSRIVGATSGTGTATVTLANSFSNNGAVHSSGDLNFSAPSITNTNTGGFSALNNLTLTATGNISNAGALYGGAQVNLTAPGSFINSATLSAPQGTIDSGGSITITAGSFTNNSSINAVGNITVSAATLRNETPGGDTREWYRSFTGADTNYSTNAYYQFPDKYEIQYWSKNWTDTQRFIGGVAPAFKPQIIGGAVLTLQNFNTATNVGGVISAPTVTLTGNGGSTFTNNDLSLGQKNWLQTWEIYTHWIALGPAMYEDHIRRNDSGALLQSSPQISIIGAGIYATTLNAGGFTLVNQGSPFAVSANGSSVSGTSATSLSGGASGTSLSGAASGTSPGTGVAGTTTASGAPAISFGGLVIALPTNPNGYFVVSTAPGAKYLVETNPLFAVGSNFVGSDYMISRYGYDPDTVLKRLGDANYEAYLIRQQLLSQTGKNILNAYANESEQMKRLMDQAFDEGKRLGLVFGQALTTDHIANLKSDIVWMVETTVAGQKVLAPVVYLSANTRKSVETGAVIAGENVNMNLASVSNTGGTISGSKSLSITSKGDITNTSGTIKGGDVSLTSVQGSVINQTATSESPSQGAPGDPANNVLGKTASIQSSNDLSISAGKDIVSRGGNISAGNNATLDAKGDITLTGVEKKTHTATLAVSEQGEFKTVTSVISQSNEVVGSTLSVGGNLKAKAGQDINVEASTVNVAKDGSLGAGRDINIKALAETSQTRLDKRTAGLNSESTEKTTVDKTTGAAAGVNIGGSLVVASGRDTNIKGSDVKVGKDLDVANVGGNLNVTTFENTTTVHSEKTTTTFFGGVAKADAADIIAPSAGVKLSAVLFGHTEDTNDISSTKNRGSAIAVGGNLNAGGTAIKGDVNLIGSEISTGGDLALAAGGDINILAAADKAKKETKSSSVQLSVGITGLGVDVASEKNSIDKTTGAAAALNVGGSLVIASGRDTNVKGSDVEVGKDLDVANVGGNLNVTTFENITTVHSEKSSTSLGGIETKADAGANAITSGKVSASANIFSHTEESTDISSTTHRGSGIAVGGNLNAGGSAIKGDVNIIGSGISTGGSLDVAAGGNINVLAAEERTKVDSKSTSVKLALSAEASIDGVSVGIGLDTKNKNGSSTETTDQVSGLKAGGNLNLNAGGDFTEQGTQVAAGGDIGVAANSIKSLAAKDTLTKSGDSVSVSASLGVKVSTGLGSLASSVSNDKGEFAFDMADASKAVSELALPEAGMASLNLSVSTTVTSSKESGTTAKTSSFVSGGDVSITARKGDATLVGTNVDAGGSIAVSADKGSIKVLAAEGTTSTFDKSTSVDVTVGISADGTISGSGSGATDIKTTGTTTQTAASFKAGKNLDLTAKEDISLVGTTLEAGDIASLTAKEGAIDFTAARDTSTSSSSSVSANASLSVNISGKSGGAGGGGGSMEKNEVSSTGTAGSIKAGNVQLKSRGDITLEGTRIAATDSASLETEGKLDFKALEDTHTRTAKGGSGQLDVSAGVTGGGLSLSVSVTNEFEQSSTKTAGSLSASNLTIKAGQGARLEGTQVDVSKDASIDTGTGKLVLESAVSTFTKQIDNTSVSISAKGDLKEASGQAGFKLKVEKEDTNRVSNQNASLNIGGKADIQAAGGIDIKGANIAGVGSVIKAGAVDTHGAAVAVEQRQDVDQSQRTDIDISVGLVVPGKSMRGGGKTTTATATTSEPTPWKSATPTKSTTASSDTPDQPRTPAKGIVIGSQRGTATSTDQPSTPAKGVVIGSQRQNAASTDQASTPDSGTPKPPVARLASTPAADDAALPQPAAPPAPAKAIGGQRQNAASTDQASTPDSGTPKPPVARLASTPAADDAAPPQPAAPPAPAKVSKAESRPESGKAEVPLKKDSVEQLIAKQLEVSTADISNRFSSGQITSVALGPTMVGGTGRLVAAEKESNIAANQRALVQEMSTLKSDSARQEAMKKIEGMDVDRLKARLDGEQRFAGEIMGKAAIPLPQPDGTIKLKPAVMAASAEYQGRLGAVQGGLKDVENMRMVRDVDAKQLAEARQQQIEQGTQGNTAALDGKIAGLEQKIVTQNLQIRQKVIETTTQSMQAEHEFLMKMLPDAANPGALASEASKVMNSLNRLKGESANLTAQHAIADSGVPVARVARTPVADDAAPPPAPPAPKNVDKTPAELAAPTRAQQDDQPGSPVTSVQPPAKISKVESGPESGKADAPLKKDPIEQLMSRTLASSVDSVISSRNMPPLVLGPGVVVSNAPRTMAVQKELGIAAQQKALLQTLPALKSDSARQEAMKKIESMDVERINARLDGERDLAGSTLGLASQPVLQPDGTLRPSPTAIAASAQYMGELGAVRSRLGAVEGMRVVRDADVKQLAEVKNQQLEQAKQKNTTELDGKIAELEQKIAVKTLDIRQELIETKISAAVAEIKFQSVLGVGGNSDMEALVQQKAQIGIEQAILRAQSATPDRALPAAPTARVADAPEAGKAAPPAPPAPKNAVSADLARMPDSGTPKPPTAGSAGKPGADNAAPSQPSAPPVPAKAAANPPVSGSAKTTGDAPLDPKTDQASTPDRVLPPPPAPIARAADAPEADNAAPPPAPPAPRESATEAAGRITIGSQREKPVEKTPGPVTIGGHRTATPDDESTAAPARPDSPAPLPPAPARAVPPAPVAAPAAPVSTKTAKQEVSSSGASIECHSVNADGTVCSETQ